MVSEKKQKVQTIINKIKSCLTRFETSNYLSELDYTEYYHQYTKKTSYEINNAIYYYLKRKKVKKLDLYINFNKVPEIIYKYLHSFIYCNVISNNGTVSIHIKKIETKIDNSNNEKLIIKDFLKLSEEEVIYDMFEVSNTNNKLKVQSSLMKIEKTSKNIKKDIYNYLKRDKKIINLKIDKTEISYDYLHTKIQLIINSDNKGGIFIFISKILEIN